MKVNTFLFTSACAVAWLSTSCEPSMSQRQLMYTHTTKADTDAYQMFHVVGSKLPFELAYATYVEGNSSSDATRQLAGRVKEVFGSIIPVLDTLATAHNVDFPIRGAKVFSVEQQEATVDSTTTVRATTQALPVDDRYITHVQHELAEIKNQFQRLSRNTNKDFQNFAVDKLHAVDDLYKQAGGKQEEGGHH